MTQVKKAQKASTSYALKAVAKHLKTIKEDGLLTKEQEATISEVMVSATQKYTKREFGI